MKPILYVLPLLLTGCAHLKTSGGKAHPQPAPSPAPLAVDLSEPQPAVLPATYEQYYVGAMADPDDPTLTYEPGQLVVQTRPERLRLGPPNRVQDGLSYGPATLAQMANDHPEPTETEMAGLVARSQRALQALSDENRKLKGAAVETPRIGPQATVAARGPAEAGNIADEHLNRIEPNADNVVELDPTLLAPPTPETSNPFVQLYRPPVAWHDLEIHVSAAVPGPAPTVVIDDEPYGVGDRFHDLTVYAVESDTVLLRKDSFLLVCPVSERPLKLRLP